MYVIRRRILPPEKALFMFMDQLPATSELISVVWKNHKDKDGYLYVNYSGENTFG